MSLQNCVLDVLACSLVLRDYVLTCLVCFRGDMLGVLARLRVYLLDVLARMVFLVSAHLRFYPTISLNCIGKNQGLTIKKNTHVCKFALIDVSWKNKIIDKNKKNHDFFF